MSQNRCANPDCATPLVVGDMALGEICHIRARLKGGPRYDPRLTEKEKAAAPNLILLCPTCYTFAGNDKTGAFSVAWLKEVKRDHDHSTSLELSAKETEMALAMLATHM